MVWQDREWIVGYFLDGNAFLEAEGNKFIIGRRRRGAVRALRDPLESRLTQNRIDSPVLKRG
jgi:hypothetical protein